MEHEKKIKSLIENDLSIRRVPRKYLDWFKQYAKEEFSNDYGQLLRELICFYKGMYTETLLSGLDVVHSKLDKVLEVLEPPKKESGLNRPKTMLERIEDKNVNRK